MGAIGSGDLNEYRLDAVKAADLSVDDTDGIGLIPLDSPTTIHAFNVDDGYSGSVPIGFDFEFDGVVYTDIDMVSTNSYLALSSAINSVNNAILYQASAALFIAPWFDDTKTSDVGYVKRETLGDAPGRRLVIEWRVFQHYNQTAANKNELVFQAVFYETANKIEFRYGSPIVVGSPSTTSTASVGVKRDTSGGVPGNVRDFFGTGHVNGGRAESAFQTTLSAVAGDDYPGDATNTQEGERYFLTFSPPLVSLVIESEAGPFSLSVAGGLFSDQIFDPVPTVSEVDFASLERLVAVSLFSDARADIDDELPVEGESRRGFWGVAEGDNFGSRLWLLERTKNTAATRAMAIDYVVEALQWLLDDGIAEGVSATLEPQGNAERVTLVVTITRGEETTLIYPDLWGRLSNAA